MTEQQVRSNAMLFQSGSEYRFWIAGHANGFVLNLRSGLTPDYIMLHRSSCRHIWPDSRGAEAFVERGYRKVGADTVAKLAEWVAVNIPEAPGIKSVCQTCQPPHLAEELIAHVGHDDAPDPLQVIDSRDVIVGAIRARRGQPRFRRDLLRAYAGRCAITGWAAEHVLEAAHIVPYRGDHTNHVTNGLLLRSDLHTLFDLGLLWIDDGSRIVLSVSLKETPYWGLNGTPLRTPNHEHERPNQQALRWHREQSQTEPVQ